MARNTNDFKSKSKIESEIKLENFIDNSKNNLTAFGVGVWKENLWYEYKGNKKVVARFSTNMKSSNSYSYIPMSMPLLDFAKAYIRYLYSVKPIINLQRHLEAIRLVEEQLIFVKESSNILELDGIVLEGIPLLMKNRKIADSSKTMIGYSLEALFDFLRTELITPALPQWSNPFPRPKDLSISLDKNGKEHRSEKLPSDEVMMLMAEMFYKGPQLSVEAEYFSAIYAILMTAPSRGSEITALPVDCLVWEEDRAGNMRLGIQWTPAKHGKAGIKWVPSVMQDIVVEAVKRIKRISEPARKAAKFAEDNTEQFWIHKDCITPSGFSIDEPLDIDQINAAVSINHTVFSKLNNAKWSKNLLEENGGAITYRVLGKQQYHLYRDKFRLWPYIDKNKNVKVSEALALFRQSEFNEKINARIFSFYPSDVNAVNKRFLSMKTTARYSSLWERHGFKLSNGAPVNLSTHQARHWLCTMAENGGLGELAIANWAGRARLRDNASYDHRTEAEKSQGVRDLMIPENANILVKIKNRLPVTFEELGKDLPGSAIVTELGICEHDYAITPCHRHGDCETCKELVCIKGFSDSLELLKSREKEVALQLEKAMRDHEMGDFGADRWVSNHGWRLAHIRTKIRLLEDESTPDGTPIRIPEEYDPTPVKETLIKKGMVKGVESSVDIKSIERIFKSLKS
jgi:hypothetical protein